VPIIDPIDLDTANDLGLTQTLESFEDLDDETAVFPRILGLVPGYAEAMWNAMAEAHQEGGVDQKLKEIMRIQLARTAHDPYFAGLRSKKAIDAGLSEERIEAGCADFENDPQFTPAEKWALRYSYLMYRKPDQVDAAFYDEGKKHFTEAQIVELGGMIAIHYGMQVFMRTVQVGPND
jgi:alkylhydroperoxidase family enzyme